MTQSPKRMDNRFLVKVDDELKARVQRVADERFGTNTSLLIRRAVETFIDPIERELDQRDESEKELVAA